MVNKDVYIVAEMTLKIDQSHCDGTIHIWICFANTAHKEKENSDFKPGQVELA